MKKVVVTVEDGAMVKLCRFLDIIDGVDEYSHTESAELATTDSQQLNYAIAALRELSEAVSGGSNLAILSAMAHAARVLQQHQ